MSGLLRLLGVAALILFVATDRAPAADAPPAYVKLGIYVTQLFGFDMPGGAYSIQFWMWFLRTDPTYKPIDSVEIVNAKAIDAKFSSTTTKEDIPWQGGRATVFWDQARYTATVLQNWDIRNYPFDRQVLEMDIEDGQADASQVAFEADVANSRIENGLEVPGWNIRSTSIRHEDHVYDTTYGDPTLQGTSTYSRIVFEIDIQRQGMRLLFSAFSGFFVAFVLVTLTYWMDIADRYDARVGLCAGAIFATIGNKLIVDTSIPPAASFTLSDGIQAATFAAILFSLVTIVILHVLHKRNPRVVGPANLTCATMSVVGYIGYISAIVYRAL